MLRKYGLGGGVCKYPWNHKCLRAHSPGMEGRKEGEGLFQKGEKLACGKWVMSKEKMTIQTW